MINKRNLLIKVFLQRLWAKFGEMPQRPIAPHVKASAKERRERLAQEALEALRNPSNHNKTR